MDTVAVTDCAGSAGRTGERVGRALTAGASGAKTWPAFSGRQKTQNDVSVDCSGRGAPSAPSLITRSPLGVQMMTDFRKSPSAAVLAAAAFAVTGRKRPPSRLNRSAPIANHDAALRRPWTEGAMAAAGFMRSKCGSVEWCALTADKYNRTNSRAKGNFQRNGVGWIASYFDVITQTPFQSFGFFFFRNLQRSSM